MMQTHLPIASRAVIRVATWYLSGVGTDFEYEEVVGGTLRIQVLTSTSFSGVELPVNSMG